MRTAGSGDLHELVDKPPGVRGLLLLPALSLILFHAAYYNAALGWCTLFCPMLLVMTVPALHPRPAFYGGILIGLLLYAPRLFFFHGIFGAAALLLWLILALWIGFFLLLATSLRRAVGIYHSTWMIPFLWTGFEYFRSELYHLRFSWLNTGYSLHDTPAAPLLAAWGVYGVGFLSAAMGAAWIAGRGGHRFAAVAGIFVIAAVIAFTTFRSPVQIAEVKVAGMQLEDSNPSELTRHLDVLRVTHPEAELLVLHEYLLGGPPSPTLLDWCRRNHCWLVIGGRKDFSDGRWQNTAYVLSPGGRVVFEQGKSVPIQFFDDGIPAGSQGIWESPWGRIGIAICYDLSYTQVMDELVKKGAQALLIPTMDAVSWGRLQHELHARVAPTRAKEHGLGIFRVASSGISQLVTPEGQIRATAPFPGAEATLGGTLQLVTQGRLPLDRWLAPVCVAVTAAALVLLALERLKRRQAPVRET